MELVTALFTTAVAGAEAAGAGLLTLTETAGAAAAGAGGAAASAAGQGLAWQGLQGTLTAGKMLMEAGAGIGALMQGEQAAKAADLQARQEALNIQRDYLIKTGAARVAFAGSGVQIGSGSAAALESSLKDQADLHQQLALAGGKAKAQAAQTAGLMGGLAAGAGILKSGADYQISVAKRGLPAA